MSYVLFGVAVAAILYTYAGFPLLLMIRNRWFGRKLFHADIAPRATMLIVAHNEAAVMRERLENALQLDYPREQLAIIVASDGSSDGTNEIVAEYADRGITLIELPRIGKIAAINAALPRCSGEILIFSDANSMCAPESIRMLVRAFADPEVGGVAGRQCYMSEESSNRADSGERTYWSFDQRLKEWQSAAGSVTSATGALYAIRRELFSPLPAGVCDDAVISYNVIAKGYRMVYEPRAVARERVASSAAVEFRRKVRICAQGFRSVMAVPTLLNPFRYGFYSVQLASHKVMRWLMPWPLAVVLFCSLALYRTAPIYRAAFVLQVAFYGMALLFALVPEGDLKAMQMPSFSMFPFFFCLAYAASLKAQWLTLMGQHYDLWQTTSHELRTKPRPGKIAYIMSRFPKITETFVLYEILAHEQRDRKIEVFPLLREREPVAHADAAALVSRAHFAPFFSAEILSANWHYLRRRPRAYLGAMFEALWGTFGSRNFFFGAIAYFPKSAAFAKKMEELGIEHIHAHFATHPALAALIIHRLTGIPFSFTAHGHDVHCDIRMLDKKLEAANCAVSVSEYNRNLMATECGEQYRRKIDVVHCGVDTGYFAPGHPGSDYGHARSDDGKLRIVCIASFLEVKGHRYLVEACQTLHQRGIKFHCDLIGSGNLRAELEKQIQSLDLASAFTMHGPRPREHVRTLLQNADVKVLPSVPTTSGLREGIPVALMEAMACGVPVISSDLSGIPELVESGVSGILVKPRDSAGLAAALERLALDPALRASLGAAGREKVVREFDLATNVEALAQLFVRERRLERALEPAEGVLQETERAA